MFISNRHTSDVSVRKIQLTDEWSNLVEFHVLKFGRKYFFYRN